MRKGCNNRVDENDLTRYCTPNEGCWSCGLWSLRCFASQGRREWEKFWWGPTHRPLSLRLQDLTVWLCVSPPSLSLSLSLFLSMLSNLVTAILHCSSYFLPSFPRKLKYSSEKPHLRRHVFDQTTWHYHLGPHHTDQQHHSLLADVSFVCSSLHFRYSFLLAALFSHRPAFLVSNTHCASNYSPAVAYVTLLQLLSPILYK